MQRIVSVAVLLLLSCSSTPSQPADGSGPDGASGGAPDGVVTDGAVDVEDAAPQPNPCDKCSSTEVCIGGRCTTRGVLVAPTIKECTHPPCMNVYNNCPVPLWTHAIGTVVIDDGQVRKLAPGEQWQYDSLQEFGGGRIYAYYVEPSNLRDTTRLVSDYNQFIEMTVDKDAVTGATAQNYNISYVDYISLPVSVRGHGSCQDTTCGARFDDWKAKLQECPTELRNQSDGLGTCIGSYIYCVSGDGKTSNDESKPYCTKMQRATGFSGSKVYGGVFADKPAEDRAFWDTVAAWNRGTVAGDPVDEHYYVHEPYNGYARWIHKELACGRVYTFSTDDHQDKAGFVRCVSPVLDVIWCPYQ